MSQVEILKILKKKKCLFAREIIDEIRKKSNFEDSSHEAIRLRLRQMVKYGDIKMIKVNKENKNTLSKKYPIVEKHVKLNMIRRPTHLYILIE